MRLNLMACLTAFCFFTSIFIFGCSPDKKESPMSNGARFMRAVSAADLATVKVLNEFGEPLAQAQILIGLAEGRPFTGNFVTTNTLGVAQIPTSWSTAEPVTVEAAGYVRQTILNQMPGDLTIKLNPAYLPVPAEISGAVTSLPVVNGDKMIDFGLMMPAMTRAELLNFDLKTMISPFYDSLSVAGQSAHVPSNLSLPTQKESYIFNLTISKPIYRMTAPTLGPKQFFAIRGQFPFKSVIDQLRAGKKFLELLNYFSIQGGGLRDVTLLGPKTTLDIPGNEMVFNSSLKIIPAAAGANEILIAVAISEVANSLVPTDIKRATGVNPMSLASLPNTPAFVVNMIKRDSELTATKPGADRMSAVLSPYVKNEQPVLLPLIENPSVTLADGYNIGLPPAPVRDGVQPLAVSATLSDISEIQVGADKVEYFQHRWEIMGLGWDQNIQLPNWPLANSTSKKRLEVNFIGTTSQQPPTLNGIIDAATHVSHSSTIF